MPIEGTCPRCGAMVIFPDHAVGRKAKCNSCRQTFKVSTSPAGPRLLAVSGPSLTQGIVMALVITVAICAVISIPLVGLILEPGVSEKSSRGELQEPQVQLSAATDIEPSDTDEDGVADSSDNCPDHANPAQADCDDDGVGDVCEIADGSGTDCDHNTVPDECDLAANSSRDCNLNGVLDVCDIASGAATDVNDNGIPDECDCRADYTGDRIISAADLARLLSAWGEPTPKEGDLDADGEVDAADLAILLSDWGECQ